MQASHLLGHWAVTELRASQPMLYADVSGLCCSAKTECQRLVCVSSFSFLADPGVHVTLLLPWHIPYFTHSLSHYTPAQPQWCPTGECWHMDSQACRCWHRHNICCMWLLLAKGPEFYSSLVFILIQHYFYILLLANECKYRFVKMCLNWNLMLWHNANHSCFVNTVNQPFEICVEYCPCFRFLKKRQFKHKRHLFSYIHCDRPNLKSIWGNSSLLWCVGCVFWLDCFLCQGVFLKLWQLWSYLIGKYIQFLYFQWTNNKLLALIKCFC